MFFYDDNNWSFHFASVTLRSATLGYVLLIIDDTTNHNESQIIIAAFCRKWKYKSSLEWWGEERDRRARVKHRGGDRQTTIYNSYMNTLVYIHTIMYYIDAVANLKWNLAISRIFCLANKKKTRHISIFKRIEHKTDRALEKQIKRERNHLVRAIHSILESYSSSFQVLPAIVLIEKNTSYNERMRERERERHDIRWHR